MRELIIVVAITYLIWKYGREYFEKYTNYLTQLKEYEQTEEKMAQLQKDIDLHQKKLSALRQSVDSTYAQLQVEKAQKTEELQREMQELQQEYEIEQEELMEQLKRLENTKELSIQALKDAESEKDKILFHSFDLSEDAKNDIVLLKEIEPRLNNKDVLRKLIYKTYYEDPMKDLFARIGVPRDSGIYKMEHIESGKVYIGQSANVYNRLREHVKASLGISSIASQAVHEEMKKEGLENFTFSLVEACSREELNEQEKYWINFYKSNEWGYNKTMGGS